MLPVNDTNMPPEEFRFLSGPVSFVQCIGKVNGTNVNVYILGDEHDSTEGTCYKHSNETIDLTSFLRYNLLNATEKVDFFLEVPYISRKDSNADIIQKRLAYTSSAYPLNDMIDELIRDGCFFQDKSVCDLKFPNVRFHYADIRFRPEVYRGRMSNLNREIPQYQLISSCVTSSIYNLPNDILGLTQQLLAQLNEVRGKKIKFSKLFMINDNYYYKLIKFNIESEQKCQKVIKDIIDKKLTLNKILNENGFENNKLIKKEMNGVVSDEIRNKIKKFIIEKTKKLEESFREQGKFKKSDYPYLFKEYNELLNQLLTYMSVLKKKGESGMNQSTEKKISILFEKVSEKYNNIMANLSFINFHILTVESYIMDIYLLARLFKKSMWNNPKTAVIFAGYFHSCNYTEFLLDMMNFKIAADARPINRRCLNIEKFKQPLFRKDINYMNTNRNSKAPKKHLKQ